VTDFIGPYQGIAGVARRAWLVATRDRDRLRARVSRVTRRGRAEPRRGDPALYQTQRRALDQSAEKSYEAAFRKGIGFHRDAALNLKGMQTILALRAKYARRVRARILALYETSIVTASA